MNSNNKDLFYGFLQKMSLIVHISYFWAVEKKGFFDYNNYQRLFTGVLQKREN